MYEDFCRRVVGDNDYRGCTVYCTGGGLTVEQQPTHLSSGAERTVPFEEVSSVSVSRNLLNPLALSGVVALIAGVADIWLRGLSASRADPTAILSLPLPTVWVGCFTVVLGFVLIGTGLTDERITVRVDGDDPVHFSISDISSESLNRLGDRTTADIDTPEADVDG